MDWLLIKRGRAVVLALALLAGTACTAGPPAPAPSTGSAPSGTSGIPTGSAPGAAAPFPGLSQTAVLADGMDTPWSVAVLPDGTALISERGTARILHWTSGGTSAVAELDEVSPAGEGGLLGLAVGPDFGTAPWVYAYLTSATDNRIVRMRFEDGVLGPAEAVFTGIPKSGNHNGGRIKFGPDGMLYAGTGDAQQADRAQDLASLGGKILRLTADGGPAPGNPFPGSPVYSVGHRNVQGLAWDSAGTLWASEFGPTVDDELNRITPGANYGWPLVTGAPGDRRFTDAQIVWPSTADASPSGMAILASNGRDFAYIGGLRGERLWQVALDAGQASAPVAHFEGDYGRIRDVVNGPGGELWLLNNAGQQSRLVEVFVK